MDEQFSFGAWVRQRRRVIDLTQQELAARVGCSEVTIRRIEADGRRPSKQLAKHLAHGLNMPAEQHEAFVKAARAQLAVDRITAPEQPADAATELQRQRLVGLPAPLSSFVGREPEVKKVRSLLRRPGIRLLTLTGLGGIGKTRVALRAAAEAAGDFADGVFFVDLASVEDPDLVAPAVADALGCPPATELPPLESVKAWLGDKQQLLLLDTFEQVIKAAPAVVELLAAAPALTVAVTSRVVLRVPGEYQFLVHPMSLPDPAFSPRARQLLQCGATKLFIERARAVNGDLRINDANAPLVAAICRRLEGLPLAIELAAASTRVLPLEQLADRLHEGVELPEIDGPAMPPRQRTLRATFGWSYRLLSGPAQAALRRLSLFAGGFSLAAAEEVCSGDDLEPQEVLGLLADLAHASLVSMRLENGQARYHMFELTRLLAREQLVEAGELALAREKHVRFFARLAEQAEPHQTAAR